MLMLLHLSTFLSVAAATSSLPPLNLHVGAPRSRTTSPGAEALRSTLNSTTFASLRSAQEFIRGLPRGQRARGVVVTVDGGVHTPLHLTAEDSGLSPTAKVIWQGIGNTTVSAGREVPGGAFKPWSSVPGAYTADLRALGVTSYGNLSTADQGTGNLGCTHNRTSLIFNGELMPLARFPNIKADGSWEFSLVDKGGSGQFGISTEDPAAYKLVKWAKEEPNPWLHGYWFYSWADGYTPLLGATAGPGADGSLAPCVPNASNGTTCTPCTGSVECPHLPACPSAAHATCAYGKCKCSEDASAGVVSVRVGVAGEEDGTSVKPGARFYGVNLKSELDAPGEWYIEDESGLLYFIPPEGSGPPEHWAEGTVVVSFNDTAVSLVDVSNVELRGLTIRAATHTGIEGTGVTGVHVANCTISGHGRHGIDLEGTNSGVESSHVYSVGGSGMRITGGEAMTLTPGGMYAHDNHVHHIGLWKRTYQPALFWGGVNNTYRRNLLEHGPAMCIWGGGNVADGVDCHFDSNTVSRCVTETCDQGSFHTCGQSGNAFINRGNVMENGFFEHIQPGDGVLTPARGLPAICSPITVGFYMDDEISGWTVRNNTFRDCQTAMLLGGGRDAIIKDNRVENCSLGLEFDNRGMNWERESNCPLAIAGLRKTLAGPAGAVYKQRWPEMLHVLSDPNTTVCDPVNDTIDSNTYANTAQFCSSADTLVTSWGSVLRNNTNLTPEPPPPPFARCKPNKSFKPSGVVCQFSVVYGAHQAGHVWPDSQIRVTADKDDCFFFEGCSDNGAAGSSCELHYHDKANSLRSTNGSEVGQGHCCSQPTGVIDYVKGFTRLKCETGE